MDLLLSFLRLLFSHDLLLALLFVELFIKLLVCYAVLCALSSLVNTTLRKRELVKGDTGAFNNLQCLPTTGETVFILRLFFLSRVSNSILDRSFKPQFLSLNEDLNISIPADIKCL